MWSLPDEELLNVLNEAAKLKLDTEFIDIIKYQFHLRKVKKDDFNIKLAR